MYKRLWPAFCCLGALLLAATPLFATVDPRSETITAKAPITERYVGPSVRGPSPMPATPAGDDDMPDRTSPRRGPSDNSTQSASVVTAAGEGWRLPEPRTGWRQVWFRVMNLWFWFR